MTLIEKLKNAGCILKLKPLCDQSGLKYTSTIHRIQAGTLSGKDAKSLVEAMSNNGVVFK